MTRRLRILEQWNSFRRDVLPRDASAVQASETKRAFYAGAFACFTVMRSNSWKTEEEGLALLIDLDAEFRDHILDLARAAGQGAQEELNPEHPVTRRLHGHWHKICALLLHRFVGAGFEVHITEADVTKIEETFKAEGGPAVLAHEKDGLHLTLISMAEGRRKAAQ